jgi:hypothetical protein
MTKLVKPVLNNYISKLSELKVKATNDILEIGKLLYEVKEQKLFEEAYDSFEEFIAIPELSFSRQTAFKAIKIYFVFVEQFALQDEIKDIDSDKLYRIAGVVDNKNVEAMIEKARYLSRSDLNAEINEMKGLPPKPTTLEIIDIFITKFPLYAQSKEALIAWESFKKDRHEDIK